MKATSISIHTRRMPRFVLIGLCFSLLFPAALLANRFVVTNTGDTGAGSLRNALTLANTPPVSVDTILFAIPGPGPHVIMPLTQLPPLLDPAGVFIDGLSQPGSTAGNAPPATAVLNIVLDGVQAGASHGLVIVTPNNTVRGLVVRNFEQDGIRIEASGAGTNFNRILCNFVGTTHNGVAVMPNGGNRLRPWAGVDIIASPLTPGVALHNTVRHNLISGNYAQGVSISSCPPADVALNIVDSNRIGTDITGMIPLGNQHDGVYIGEAAHDNIIRHNLISGNDTDGVSIVGYVDASIQWYTHSNRIIGNIIGTAVDRNTPMPNRRHGVSIGKYGNVWLLGFAPSNEVSNNLIAYNGGHGVMVWEHPFNTTNCDKNRIIGNSIHHNARQGIDLDDDGISLNDPADADFRANQTLNTPRIDNAQTSGANYSVRGIISIDTDPTLAVVEVYIATQVPPGLPQGQTLLGSAAPDAAGNWVLTGTGVLTSSDTVVALVTDLASNTSEFSAPFPVNGPVIAGPVGVSFGTVIVTRSADRAVVIRNTGKSPLVIAGMILAPAVFTQLSPPPPMIVPPSDSTIVQLRFTPSAAGLNAGSLTITSNAANAPVYIVALSGIAVDSAAEISNLSGAVGVDFGAVIPGDSSIRSAVFTNTGNAYLTITSLGIDGPDSSQFSIVQPSATQIAPGRSDSVVLRFLPTALGTKRATLRIGSNDPNTPLFSMQLRGDCIIPQPRIVVTPAALSFDTVLVSRDRLLDLLVQNTGMATLSVSGQAIIGADSLLFTITRSCAPSLAPGATDTIRVRFAPDTPGGKSAALVIACNDTLQPISTVPLSGYGRAGTAAITLNPGNLDFGTVAAGTNAERSIVVRNTGTAPLTISNQVIFGPDSLVYTITRMSSASLAPDASDTIRIRFAPADSGAKQATLAIACNDPLRPIVTATLSGTGRVLVPIIAVNPLTLDYDTVLAGSSMEHFVLVRNAGTAPLTISSQAITGADSLLFTITRFCAPTLAPDSSDTLRVRFAPVNAGAKTATLRIANSDASTPEVQVSLRGTGHVPSPPRINVDPNALVFGRVVPAGSRMLSVRVQNRGGTPLTLTSQRVEGGDSSVFLITRYAQGSIAPGGTDSLHVLYAPLAFGVHASQLRLANSDPSTPMFTVSLSGSCATSEGPALLLSRTSVDFGYVPLLGAKEETLRVTSSGTAPLLLQQQLVHGTNASMFTMLQIASTPLPAGASSIVRIRFSPNTAGGKSAYYRIISNDASTPLLDVPLSGTTVNSGDAIPSAAGFVLAQNYPNPLHDRTAFAVAAADGGHLSLVVVDALGRRVRMLADSELHGNATINWDRLDDSGQPVPAGMYRCVGVLRGERRVVSVVVR